MEETLIEKDQPEIVYLFSFNGKVLFRFAYR